MADHNINININQPSATGTGGAGGSFASTVSDVNNLTAALNTLTAKMEEVSTKSRESSDKSKKSILDYSGSYSQLRNEIASTRVELSKELDLLNQLRSARIQENNAIESQKIKVSELESKLNTLNSQQRTYISTLGNTTSASIMSGNAIKQMMGAFGYTAGIFGAILALKQIYGIVSDFQDQNKKLQSILGETSNGMKELSQSAIELGSRSIFGAEGITKMQIEFAKMGESKQAIEEMQSAIVNLATVTQYDLGDSATMVTMILKNFRMPASQATEVVDQLGYAFTHSRVNIENFSEAMKYIAPIAKDAGISFKDMLAVLMALSMQNITGSLAGTSFANVLSKIENNTSKMNKTFNIGATSLEGLLSGLDKMNNTGSTFQDVVKGIDKRALATFSTLKDGTDVVRGFDKDLDHATGTMEKMKDIQLESLTNRVKLLDSQWKSFVLSIESGEGELGKFFSAFIDEVSATLFTMRGGQTEAIKSAKDAMTDVQSFLHFAQVHTDSQMVETMGGFVAKLTGYIKMTDNAGIQSAYTQKKNADELIKGLDEITAAKSKMLTQYATPMANKAYDEQFAKLHNVKEATDESIKSLKAQQAAWEVGSVKYQVYGRAIELIKAQMNIEPPKPPDLTEKIKYLEELKKVDLADLENKKKLAEQEIQLTADKSDQERLIKLSDYSFDIAIQAKTHDWEVQIAEAGKIDAKNLAKWKEDEAKINANKTIILANQMNIDLMAIDDKRRIALMKANSTLTEENKTTQIEILKDQESFALDQIAKEKEVNDELIKQTTFGNNQKLQLQINAFNEEKKTLDTKYAYDIEISRLTIEKEKQIIEDKYAYDIANLKVSGDKTKQMIDDQHTTDLAQLKVASEKNKQITEEHLLALKALYAKYNTEILKFQHDHPLAFALGFTDEDTLSKFNSAIGQMKTGIKSLVDAWKSGTDDIVSQYDRQVSEAQSALDTELQLSGQGYASNVTLKRKELADIKSARDSAMKEQIAAERAQLAIDNAMTISDMVVTFANILKNTSKLGLLAIPLTIAAGATIWGMFEQWKSLLAKEKVVTFGSGGEIYGQSHSSGGVMINAEGGEYVVNRKSTMKYKPLIDAINKDDRIVLDRMYLQNIRGGTMKHTVSLDDSKDLKAIRSLLEKQGKTVEFQNGFRIERFGNTTTRIKINYN